MFKNKKKGLSLPELIISVSILAFVVLSASVILVSNYNVSRRSNDLAFATQKANQILEELRSLVQSGSESDIINLDAKDDKDIPNPSLTTEVQVINDEIKSLSPDSFTSGNQKSGNGRWKFLRKVRIERRPDDERARNVFVTMAYGDEQGNMIKPSLVSLRAVVRTSGSVNLASQAIDLFSLQVDNMSGWWADVQPLKNVFDSVTNQLTLVNPGLDFRLHSVNRMTYGRDPYYSPYINNSTDIRNVDVNHPYFYPGLVKNIFQNRNTLEYYFPATEMDEDGMRLIFDGDSKNDWFDSTGDFVKKAFSAADTYNHGLRYPDEVSAHRRYNKNNIDSNTSLNLVDDRQKELEPTLRLFLEKMKSTSDYRSALITNLHGESLPLPPIRNYSDAAKDPKDNMYKRVVTHPENLQYLPDTSTGNYENKVKLRVYPYLMKPNDTGNDKMDKITLFIPTNQFVGNKISESENQTNPDLPSFSFDVGSLPSIKNDISISYISGNSSKEYRRVSPHYNYDNMFDDPNQPVFTNVSAEFAFTISGSPTVANDALVIPKGTSIVGGNSVVFRTIKDLALLGGQTKTVRATSEYVVSPIYDSGTNPGTNDDSNFYLKNNDPFALNISTINPSNLTLVTSGDDSKITGIKSLTNVPFGEIGPVEGKYSIEVNPAFDRDGDGTKERVQGILITLYDSETKHKMHSSSGTGLKSNKRLYGLEYIPSPLGDNMFKPDGTSGSVTASADGNTKSVKYPAEGTNYKTFYGRDLDSNLNDHTKNTARWIISLDLQDGICPSTPTLACFSGSMMSVETRIGNDLNSGMTMNQSINTFDGVVDSPDGITINDPSNCSACGSSVSQKEEALNKLQNISRTYVWLGKEVPLTEQFQFLGDKRHNPYLDVLQERRFNHYFSDDSTSNSPGASYVSYDFKKWPGFIKDYFNKNYSVDLPRWNQVYRESFAHSNAVYNSITGYSNWMHGLGGEISLNSGFNSQNFKFKGIPYGSTSESNAWSGGSWSDSTGDSLRVIARKDKAWVSIPWLGELYPDEAFIDTNLQTDWRNDGNLPSHTSNGNSDKYIRFRLDDKNNSKFKGIDPNGSSTSFVNLHYKDGRVTSNGGAPMFFNGSVDPNNRARYFSHGTNNVSQILTSGGGQALASNYGLAIPPGVNADRHFGLEDNGTKAAMWDDKIYEDTATIISLLDPANGPYISSTIEEPNDENTFFRRDPPTGNKGNREIGSGIIRTELPYLSGEPNVFYVAMSGLQAPRSQGKGFIAKFAIAATMHAYLSTGDLNHKGDIDATTADNKSIMIPRIEIADPKTKPESIKGTTPTEGSEIDGNNTSSINIDWNTSWKKWDNEPYTSYYPSLWLEKGVTIHYNVIYSPDGGSTWKYITTGGGSGADASPGYLNKDSQYLFSCSSSCLSTQTSAAPAVQNTVAWDISGLSEGSYIFRVEGYRNVESVDEDIKLHYSYHQREVYISKD